MFKRILAMTLSILLIAAPCWSAIEVQDDGEPVGIVNSIDFVGSTTTVSNSVGTVTLNDIDSGTIDGAVIGGTTPAAGTFTELTANTSITLGGATITGWGSVVSPWTTYTGYAALTSGGTDTKMHDDGDITIGGNTSTDVVIIWDTDSDFYCGFYNTDDELQLGYGSALDTQNLITLTAGLNIRLFDGTTADSQLVIDGGGYDYHIGIDDAGNTDGEDVLIIGRGATVGTTPALIIDKTGVIFADAIAGLGNADLDIGDATTTSVDVVTDGGTIVIDGQFTMHATYLDIISNSADDVMQISSDDAVNDITLRVYAGFNDKDAILELISDISTDSGDDWTIKNDDGASNDLLFMNDITGTDVAKYTFGRTGILTSINYFNLVIDDTTDGEMDLLRLTHSSSDNDSSDNDAVSIAIHMETDANSIEEFAEIDFVATDVSNGAEDVDITFTQYTAGELKETLDLVSASSATVADYLQYTSHTTEDNLITDILKLRLDDTGDTRTDSFGAGISIQLDDEDNAIEEHASIDFQLTDAGTGAEDCDIIFSQSVNSTVTSSLLLNADAGLDLQVTGWDLIFPGDETIDNDTANTLTVRSNDEATTLYIMGYTDKAAKLILDADLGADVTDTWIFEAEDGTDLTLDNGGTEILEISSGGNLQIDGDLSVDGGDIDTGTAARLKFTTNTGKSHKYHYYPMSYVSASAVDIGGGADTLVCVGLTGTSEVGATEGYVTLKEPADRLRFRFHMPETFIDTGVEGDFILQFLLEELVTTDAVTYDVAIYERGNTTALFSDQITAINGTTKDWVNLETEGAGFGDDIDLDADDILVITVTPELNPPEDHQYGNIYGCRIKYVTGIEATQ